MNTEQKAIDMRKQSCHKNRSLLRCSSFIIHCSNAVGFTLIELLVVISIIGILTTLVIVNLIGIRERVRDTQRKTDLYAIKVALVMHKGDHNNFFPPDTGDNRIVACYPPTGVTIDWGLPFQCGTMVYMKILPFDPLPTQDYMYLQTQGGDGFCLWATLENKSDSAIRTSQTRCGTCSVGVADFVVCED